MQIYALFDAQTGKATAFYNDEVHGPLFTDEPIGLLDANEMPMFKRIRNAHIPQGVVEVTEEEYATALSEAVINTPLGPRNG